MDTAVIPAIKPALAKAGAGIQTTGYQLDSRWSLPRAKTRGGNDTENAGTTKNIMPFVKKLLITSGFLLLAALPALAATAPAANQNTGVSPAGRDVLRFLGDTANRAGLTNSPDPDADTTDVYDIIAAIINTVLGLTGIIFFIQVFWAGFRWMTAGGAEETITTAKKTIVSSVIGIAIALSAFVITNFVLNKIEEINKGGGGTSGAPEFTPPPPLVVKCEYTRPDGLEMCEDITATECVQKGGQGTPGGQCPPPEFHVPESENQPAEGQ